MTAARWIDVTARETLATRRWMEVEAGPHALLLYDIDGQVFATSAICPHHAAWLSQGSVDGDHVNCPRHQGRFHIPTGTMVRGPTCDPLKTYPVKTENDRILVWIG